MEVGTILAIAQVSGQVAKLCKFYIETARDAPSDLHAIFIRVSATKTIFDSLKFLITHNSDVSDTLKTLASAEGMIPRCLQVLTSLEKLLPSNPVPSENGRKKPTKKERARLCLDALAWPLKAGTAAKLIKELDECTTAVNLAFSVEAMRDIKDIKAKASMMEKMLVESERSEVYAWLVRTDPSPLHNRARGQYEPGTGDWVLRSPEWKNWLSGTERSLWIHGIPGAGKTVLFSHLVQNAPNVCEDSVSGKGVGCVYYYCYHARNQNEAAPFLRWLVCQLSRQSNQLPTAIHQAFKAGVEPTLDQLLAFVYHCLDEFEAVYVFIDAVDECQQRTDLLDVIRCLVTDPGFKNIRLLSTSREYSVIEKVLETVSKRISMDNPAVTHDISLYVHSVTDKDPRISQWPPSLLVQVRKQLPAQAKGMFRWAVCQIDCLRRLQPKEEIIKNALANLPEGLDDTYIRIFQLIPQREWPFVRHTLRWIFLHNDVTKGFPVSIKIIVEAFKRGQSEGGNEHRGLEYDQDVLKDVCGCLIKVAIGSICDFRGRTSDMNVPVVSFAHYTVREFLEEQRIIRGPASYFSLTDSSIVVPLAKEILEQASKTCKPGMDLAEICPEDDEIRLDGTEDFSCLEDSSTYNVFCAALIIHRRSRWIVAHSELQKPAFDFLSTFPSSRIKKILVHDGGGHLNYVNTDRNPDGLFWNVRFFECTPAEATVVQILVVQDVMLADIYLTKYAPNLSLKDMKVDLYWLSMTRTVVRNAGRFSGSIAHVFACLSMSLPAAFHYLLDSHGVGFVNPTELLLKHIAAHEECQHTKSADKVHEILTRPVGILIEAGADVDGRGCLVTPLQIAAYIGHDSIAKLLLEAGADPNYAGNPLAEPWYDVGGKPRFWQIHGKSPLRIQLDDGVDFRKYSEKVTTLLRQYGARSFSLEDEEEERREKKDGSEEVGDDDRKEDGDAEDERTGHSAKRARHS